MKIRIKGNSVRLRLTRTEVETFCETGMYTETTEFISQQFVYELRVSAHITEPQADFKGAKITVLIPLEESKNWANDTKVGFEGNYRLPSGKSLYLLIEKDFVCLDDRDEDESDNYPNPLAIKNNTTN